LPGPPSPDGRSAVAYSGGLDSTVLLAGMTRLTGIGRVRALHIDHALHPDSAHWARRCAEVCAVLGVPFESARIEVDVRSGTGIEAAARAARYAALVERLDPGESLLTAHHADDQLETLLLRLFRGTGVRGLRGILPTGPAGAGRLARPLLDCTRAELRAIAAHWSLAWLEDPSNASLELDRNLVRSRLTPVIRERWGDSAATRANRLAAAMRDAESILEAVARADLAAAAAKTGRVPLAPLRALDAARQRNALRLAVRAAGLALPDAARLEALRAGIGATPAEAARRVEWRGGEARLFKDRFYLLSRSARSSPSTPGAHFRTATPGKTHTAAPQIPAAKFVSASVPWQGFAGRLVLEPLTSRPRERAPSATDGFPESWARQGLEVRFRAGGERFRPAGGAHHKTLKAWFWQAGIVPWMRDRVPLLYRDGRLVAVADLALAEHARRAEPGQPRWCARWLEHPPID
jgi:tRNA(Ile)-lysidine synthase